MRIPRCKVCRAELLNRFSTTTVVCSPACARDYAEQKRLKKERKEYRDEKEKQKTKTDYAKSAEHACNAYIRARDKYLGYGCISCGTHANVQYAAGHYRTVKACPELRYHEWNINLQCNRYCNSKLSGNILEYRIALIARIGIDKVEWIEGKHQPRHYTIENLKTIEKWYKRKLKRLKQKIVLA